MKMVKVDNDVIKEGRGVYRSLRADIEEFIAMDIDTVELVGVEELYPKSNTSSIVASYNMAIKRTGLRVRAFARKGRIYLTRLVDRFD